MPVHQQCYAVKAIPAGQWFCYPCADGLDPKTLACELCPYTGGAYKYTDKAGKWAHPICANWIPEVYEVHDPNKPVYINLKFVDPKRFKLKCSICSKKGACVQCAFGRCSVAAHSWCALRNTTAGYTKRIVKDGDSSQWEIFCKTHAAAVSDPVKPKKVKQTSIRLEDEEEISFAPKKDRSNDVAVDKHGGSGGTQLLSTMMDSYRSDSDDESVDEENRETFPIVSLSEWPGMAEGEGMDGEHFMNNVSAYFPEDHSHKVRQIFYLLY